MGDSAPIPSSYRLFGLVDSLYTVLLIESFSSVTIFFIGLYLFVNSDGLVF